MRHTIRNFLLLFLKKTKSNLKVNETRGQSVTRWLCSLFGSIDNACLIVNLANNFSPAQSSLTSLLPLSSLAFTISHHSLHGPPSNHRTLVLPSPPSVAVEVIPTCMTPLRLSSTETKVPDCRRHTSRLGGMIGGMGLTQSQGDLRIEYLLNEQSSWQKRRIGLSPAPKPCASKFEYARNYSEKSAYNNNPWQ